MADSKEKLFSDFPGVSTEAWMEKITADLKGADFEKKLVWKTNEGFKVKPFYRQEDLEGLKTTEGLPGQFPYVRGIKKDDNTWLVRQDIQVECPKEANAKALDILNKGIDSLGFKVNAKDLNAEYIETLLNGICAECVELNFSTCQGHTVELAKLLVEYFQKQGYDLTQLQGSVNYDPMGKMMAKGKDLSNFAATAKELVDVLAPLPKYRCICVNAVELNNAGSYISQELGYALAWGNEYLNKLIEAGVPATSAAKRIKFNFGISSNYFLEIAKFRAARMLWANIVKGYNPEKNCACKMQIHAETSKWNQTVYDPYVNMLRGTTEAMSAAIGGVYSLEVTPFDASFENPTEFSKRIARNVELLLKHESHFDQVVDPAGGSYYIENLTQSIAAEAWKLFLEIEEKGGYTEAYKAGFIAERIKASAAAKDKNIATRRQILLGANQYPNFTEVAGKEITAESVTRKQAEGNVLVPYRGAMAFEEMRLHVDRSGKEPKAFMLTCGNLGMARARSQFSCNFFACAGIKVIDNTYFKSIEEGVKAALESKAQIVVVCASDDDYAEAAPKIKELLGGKAILVVAGAPACAPELEAQGITNFINVKSNVLETLKFYLKEMGI